MLAAVDAHAGRGCFDHPFPGEGSAEGCQSVPVDLTINSARAGRFFAA
jgi:hypothetical protein